MESASTMPQSDVEMPRRHDRRERRHIAGPVILVVIGLIFLGQNLGMLPSDTWISLWQFWPVLLIIAGIELIFSHSSIGSTIASLIIIAMVIAMVATFAFFGQMGNWTLNGAGFEAAGPVVTKQMTQEIGSAQRGIIDLEHAAGRLEVSSLPVESSQLFEADVASGQYSGIDKRAESQGDGTYVRLAARNNSNGFPFGNSFRQDWTVRLSPDVPIELRVHSGASAVAMDLSKLKVTNLNVDSGASSVDMTLPEDAGRTEAHVKAGVAGVHIRIPDGVAGRIRVQNGLSGSTIDQFRFPKNGSYYQSPDFDTATNRVELYVETGVSGLTID